MAGSETALMSLNRYHLRHKARKGNRGAKLAEQLLKRPDRLIGLILLGNNLVNFSASALVTLIAFNLGGEPAVAIGTGILTLTVIIFADIAPKSLAALNPERFAFPAAMVYYPLLKVTYPIVWLTNMASNSFLYLLGVRDKGSDLQTLTREELRTVVRETSTRIPTRYREMLLSILDLEKVTVADVMVPQKEIIGIDLNENNADIEIGDLLVTSGLGGKFPSGYPVAKVDFIESDLSEQFYKVSAKPIAYLNQVREVMLLKPE